METKMEKGLCIILMGEFMKDNGKIILSMGKAIKNFIMEQSMKDHMLKVNLKDMEDIHGTMEKPMKVNGSME